MKPLSDVIDSIRPIVTQIRVTVDNPHDVSVAGTGFIINEHGIVMTARHVIEACLAHLSSNGAGHISVALAIPNFEDRDRNIVVLGNFEDYDCEVVALDPMYDLALLRLSPNPFSDPPTPLISVGDVSLTAIFGTPTFQLERLRDGTAVATSGYPLKSPTMVTTAGTIASSWEIESIGAFRSPGYLADMSVNRGNSGGPVYSVDDGKVVGVCVAYKNATVETTIPSLSLYSNSGLCVVVPISHGLELLRQHT